MKTWNIPVCWTMMGTVNVEAKTLDEAIEIGKDFSSEKSGVFINGILNGVKDSLPPGSKDTPPQKK